MPRRSIFCEISIAGEPFLSFLRRKSKKNILRELTLAKELHFCLKNSTIFLRQVILPLIRGIGAAGSAFDWQSKGQGFEPPMLHQTEKIRTFSDWEWFRIFCLYQGY